jgi:hypothetical protein
MEDAPLKTNVIKCFLYDLTALNPKEGIEYIKPIYTKFDGVYGYLAVSMFNVFFIYNNEHDVDSEDVSGRFRIEYTSSKV